MECRGSPVYRKSSCDHESLTHGQSLAFLSRPIHTHRGGDGSSVALDWGSDMYLFCGRGSGAGVVHSASTGVSTRRHSDLVAYGSTGGWVGRVGSSCSPTCAAKMVLSLMLCWYLSSSPSRSGGKSKQRGTRAHQKRLHVGTHLLGEVLCEQHRPIILRSLVPTHPVHHAITW